MQCDKIVSIVFNIFSAKIGLYTRFDLTSDNRYTLSPEALKIIDEVESPILIDVFLERDLNLGFILLLLSFIRLLLVLL